MVFVENELIGALTTQLYKVETQVQKVQTDLRRSDEQLKAKDQEIVRLKRKVCGCFVRRFSPLDNVARSNRFRSRNGRPRTRIRKLCEKRSSNNGGSKPITRNTCTNGASCSRNEFSRWRLINRICISTRANGTLYYHGRFICCKITMSPFCRNSCRITV